MNSRGTKQFIGILAIILLCLGMVPISIPVSIPQAYATGNPPAAPVLVKANRVSPDNSTQQLTWVASTGATWYKIDQQITSTGTFSTIVANTTNNGVVNTVSSLTPGTQYGYRVWAGNGSGLSTSPSNVVVNYTQTRPATNLNITLISPNTLRLAWNNPAGNFSGFAMSQKTIGGSFSVVATTTNNTNRFDYTGLNGNTKYGLEFRTLMGGGLQSFLTSEVDQYTTPNPPDTTHATSISSSQIRVDWQPYAGNGTALGYKIENSTDNVGWNTVVANTGNSTSKRDFTGLHSGYLQYYRVSTIKDGGTSVAGPVAFATTGDGNGIICPTNSTFSYIYDAFSGQAPYNITSAGGTTPNGLWNIIFHGSGWQGATYNSDLCRNVYNQQPLPIGGANGTRAPLAVSTKTVTNSYGSYLAKTVQQFRTPTPNNWETNWLFFHWIDSNHQYYFYIKTTDGFVFGKKDNLPGDNVADHNITLKTSSTVPHFALNHWYNYTWSETDRHIIIKVDGVTYVDYQDNGGGTTWLGGTNGTAKTSFMQNTPGGVGMYEEDAKIQFSNVYINSNTTDNTVIVTSTTSASCVKTVASAYMVLGFVPVLLVLTLFRNITGVDMQSFLVIGGIAAATAVGGVAVTGVIHSVGC